MEISFWIIIAGIAIIYASSFLAFLIGWFLGSGFWDERTAGYHSQFVTLRARLNHCETCLTEERAISAEAQKADLELSKTGEATSEIDVLRGEITSLRAQLNAAPPPRITTRVTVRPTNSDSKTQNQTVSTPVVDAFPQAPQTRHAAKIDDAPTQPPETPETSLSDQKSQILQRIRQNASKLDFTRIGNASENANDDLQKIKGIGPFIEEKLHTAGIHTFRQIANFNAADEDLINEIIEFFPGRVRREEWTRQAREMLG